MASTHGFRVFIVEAFPNRKSGNDPFDAQRGSGLRDEICLALHRIVEKGTHRFAPKPKSDGTPSGKPVSTATVSEVVEIGDGIIHLTIAVGETGSHAFATRPSKPRKNLAKWSPEVEHSMTFIFPNSSDSRFVIVAHTIHRRDAHARLLSMIKDETIRLRRERVEADQAARAAASQRGEKPGKLPRRQRLAFVARQATDDQYLDEILAGADSASVVFKSTRMSARGRAGQIDRVLQIKLRDENVIEVGRTLAHRWAKRWRDGHAASRLEGLSEASDLLAELDLVDEGEEARYDSVSISVQSKSKVSTTIAVDTLRDAFTYPVSDYRPDYYFYYDAVSSRLRSIASQESLDLDTIDPAEMNRCLTG